MLAENRRYSYLTSSEGPALRLVLTQPFEPPSTKTALFLAQRTGRRFILQQDQNKSLE